MYKTIKDGSMLYRATSASEMKPIPMKCNKTFKTGVYFCYKNPVMAELAALEKCEDLIITRYMVVSELIVYRGRYHHLMKLNEKYGEEFLNSYNSEDIENSRFYTEFNRPHYMDYDIKMKCVFKRMWNNYIKAEVFLNKELLSTIIYMDEYKFTVKDAVRKYITKVDL